jgi:hypothetical protein
MGASEFRRVGWLRRVVSLLVVAVMSLGVASRARAADLVSVAVNGRAGNAPSSGPAANADGSFVTFYSDATDLVVNDTNMVRDVFLRDRMTETTERLSVNSAGDQSNGPSQAAGHAPAIDSDGQIVAFYSDATNLVADDMNRQTDAFVRLRASGTTELVSISTDGTQGNGPSVFPSINGDGSLVAFQSQASNLAPDDTNGVADIFVRDRANGTTERLCPGVEGNGASSTPAVSADGNVVAFASAATNLVPNDLNRFIDIFVCDRGTGTLELVSVSSEGVQGNGDSILPAISEDGRFVAFKSTASNLVPNDNNGFVDVFVRDRVAGTTVRASVNFRGGDANDNSFPPSISYDGRFVAFGSAATNLVPNDFNNLSSVFVRDLVNAVTLLVDVNDLGQQANGGTPDIPPAISGDGNQIGYASFANNLVVNDRNETVDVFINRNPFICDEEHPCPVGFLCVDGICVPAVTPSPTPTGPTPTPTPTPGAMDCCQCPGPACELPVEGMCPAQCNPIFQAVCLGPQTPGAGNCATVTPTPTLGPNDCCQCTGPACELPVEGACPAECDPIRMAVCLGPQTPGAGNCATVTPTPTLGPNDCCQCAGPACELPVEGACPAECDPVRMAVCLGPQTPGAGNCATVTPTPTLGPNDCCQCAGPACELPVEGACPAECDPVRMAVCLGPQTPGAGNCATVTPGQLTPTPTPTSTTVLTPTHTPTSMTVVTASATPTGTALRSPTATRTSGVSPESDACNCRIARPEEQSYGKALLGLGLPLALIVWRRRCRK